MTHPDRFSQAPEEPASVPDNASFGEILSDFEQQQTTPQAAFGETRQGIVVSVSGDSVYVNIGRKLEGVLNAAEVRDASGNLKVKAGDTVLVTITGRDEDGYYVLSTAKVARPKDWSSLEKAFAAQSVIAGVVEEVIKGGLKVDVGARAFLPASRSGVRDQAEVEKLIGQEIRCKIIKLDTAEEDVVVDRRVVLEEEEAKTREQTLASLAEGAVIRGTVRSLMDYGAFVDLGGVDGLLHVADIAWNRVSKPADVLSVGDQLEVKVLKIDRAARRISLGIKQLLPDPWSLAAEKYTSGSRVRGRVVRVADFGAFVELEPGVEGLVHVSEMSWSKKSRKPSDIVKTGEIVEVAVLSVNAAERRIGLGLKQTLGDPWEQVEKNYAPGAIVEKPITSITNFGAFVELEDGIEGMIHIGDISREKRLQHPKEAVSVGKVVRAVVLEIDRERRRIRLGMKQLEPTSADDFIAEHQVGDKITGRIAELGSERAKVEVADGVFASCRLPRESKAAATADSGGGKADLSALTAMLSAKWKQGASAGPASSPEPARAGQVRQFRIVSLDPSRKSLEVELA